MGLKLPGTSVWGGSFQQGREKEAAVNYSVNTSNRRGKDAPAQ